jgi:sodium transport system permease protein
MRWPVVRLIWVREVRDLLRDRRTLFMMVGLPVLLYPAFGLIGFLFALSMLDQVTVVGIHGQEHLPAAPASPTAIGPLPAQAAAWLAALSPPEAGPGSAAVVAAVGGSVVARQPLIEFPPLIRDGRLVDDFCDSRRDARTFQLVTLPDSDRGPLNRREVDVLLSVPADFRSRLEHGERPEVVVLSRDGDETSKLGAKRLSRVLGRYKKTLKNTRFARHGLPPDFDDALEIDDLGEQPAAKRSDESRELKRTTDELRDALVRFFPFMLVMWTLAGALHPAVDLCAGEKERGTMETLLISPAERSEIVAGKFLAVWLFAAGAALWNLFWMGGLSLLGGWYLGIPLVSAAGLGWCVVLLLPLAALFSALCLALGVYARSTKEGQYYMLPLFLLNMPLVMLSLMPGIDLTLGYSLVPVTGACLLLQRLMAVQTEPSTWLYFGPVLLALAVYVILALRWAAAQFRREEVLFREAERLDLRLWLRGLFRRQ